MFRLREIRELSGLSIQQLASLSGVHFQTIQALETGKNNPYNAKLSTLIAICRALGCKMYHLYPNEKDVV